MTTILSDDSVVSLHPLNLGEPDEEEQEVGRADTGVFISLPVQGVDIIKWLDEGLTVGEVKNRFAERYGEAPDLDDFLAGLTECGFVRSVNGTDTVEAPGAAAAEPAPRGWRLLANVRQERVAWLVSKPVRVAAAALWPATAFLVIVEPQLLPRADDAWPSSGVTVSLLALTLLSWLLMFLHEVAHLLAVRARGCVGFLQLSHRLHFVVAQTDMSSIRSIPRKDRYAPYLAGMTFDVAVLFSASVLRLLGAGGRFASTVAFVVSIHLLFQLAFFMRTDLYYVLTNRFKLGNLMGDTRSWLGNQVRKAFGRTEANDLSAVPERELRAVRWYAALLVTGVAVTLGQFFIFGVPLMVRFGVESIGAVRDGADSPVFWDGVTFIALTVLNFGLLAFVMIRGRTARARSMSGAAAA